MQPKRIVVDAGHGRGNRRPGVFDPGAVRSCQNGGGAGRVAATEADFALRYAIALDAALRARSFLARLTRADNTAGCSLRQRLALAQETQAALLVSLHLNAAPARSKVQGPKSKVESPKSQAARGHEVLYWTEGSRRVAEAVSAALAQHIPPHGLGVVRRPNLYVLRYDPSVLIEVGFLDSDEDFALLADDLFKVAAMESVAGAIAALFGARGDGQMKRQHEVEVRSPESEARSLSANAIGVLTPDFCLLNSAGTLEIRA